MLSAVITVLITIGLFIYLGTRKPKGFPPGPPRLPIVGSGPYLLVKDSKTGAMINSPFQLNRMLIKKYGKVVGYYIGNNPAVLIADFQILRDVLKRDDTTGRPEIMTSLYKFRYGADMLESEKRGDGLGIVFSMGNTWREQRRFVTRNLRDFGFGKVDMEASILEQVNKLIAKLKKDADKSISLKGIFNLAVINALWIMMTSNSLDFDDPELIKLVQLLDNMASKSSLQSTLLFLVPPKYILYPGFRHLSGFEDVRKGFGALQFHIRSLVEKRIQNHVEGANRDLMDVVLDHVKETKDSSSSFYGDMGIVSFVNVITDIFFAGSESSSSTLRWTILILLHHPEFQKTLQDEIDKVVGRERLPNLGDRKKMHYTNAFLEEVFRYASIGHQHVPHIATGEDIVLENKMVIPKNSMIFGSLFAIMNDPDYWVEPEKFNPERFLDPKTGEFRHDERIIPFSVGKRACIGQSLAEKQIFLFFTAIMQTFTLSTPSGSGALPSIHPDDYNSPGQLRVPPDYQVVLSIR